MQRTWFFHQWLWIAPAIAINLVSALRVHQGAGPLTGTDPINIVNLVLGVSSDQYTVRAWVKNLTGEDENQLPYETENGDPALPGAWTGSFFPGREFGLTFSYRF